MAEQRSGIVTDPTIAEEAVRFRGHMCPGLTMGVRAIGIAPREVCSRSSDEVVARVGIPPTARPHSFVARAGWMEATTEARVHKLKGEELRPARFGATLSF